MKKLRIGVLFGGRSGEHEVSLLSAASIVAAIDTSKYEVVLIGISKEGRWLAAAHAERLLKGEAILEARQLRAGDPARTPTAAVLRKGEAVVVPPMPAATGPATLVPVEAKAPLEAARWTQDQAVTVDVIFPVLHGTFGEDGTVQGLLELADIPYVGAGVLGSAAGMDKEIMKRLFRDERLPLVAHVTVLRRDWEADPRGVRKRVEATLRYPVFVKPANLGSSVGVTKAHDRNELGPALDEAGRYDRKILVEQSVGGKRGKAREIECSVLGNDDPEASVPGEIVPAKEFYDYAAKYLEEGSRLVIPAGLGKAQTRRVRELAIRAFRAVDGAGLARVDFLMDPRTEKIYVNEINTMPGFTSISMYPKLWEASGVPYPDLIDRLIKLALERHAQKKRNRYSRE